MLAATVLGGWISLAPWLLVYAVGLLWIITAHNLAAKWPLLIAGALCQLKAEQIAVKVMTGCRIAFAHNLAATLAAAAPVVGAYLLLGDDSATSTTSSGLPSRGELLTGGAVAYALMIGFWALLLWIKTSVMKVFAVPEGDLAPRQEALFWSAVVQPAVIALAVLVFALSAGSIASQLTGLGGGEEPALTAPGESLDEFQFSGS